MSDKPLESFPVPDQFKPRFKKISEVGEDLRKRAEKMEIDVLKFKANAAEFWSDLKEYLANIAPDKKRVVYGATNLHYNEENETIEIFRSGEGPAEMPKMDLPPIMMNFGEKKKPNISGEATAGDDAITKMFRRGGKKPPEAPAEPSDN